MRADVFGKWPTIVVLQYRRSVPIDSVTLLAHTFKFFANCRLPCVLVLNLANFYTT